MVGGVLDWEERENGGIGKMGKVAGLGRWGKWQTDQEEEQPRNSLVSTKLAAAIECRRHCDTRSNRTAVFCFFCFSVFLCSLLSRFCSFVFVDWLLSSSLSSSLLFSLLSSLDLLLGLHHHAPHTHTAHTHMGGEKTSHANTKQQHKQTTPSPPSFLPSQNMCVCVCCAHWALTQTCMHMHRVHDAAQWWW